MMHPRAAALLGAAGLLLAGTGAHAPAAPRSATVVFSGPTMGTTFTVKVVPGPGGLTSDERQVIDDGIRDLLARIDRQISTWRNDSDLARFNESESLDPVPFGPEAFALFEQAVAVATFTGGAVDVTVAPVVDAWGFGPHGQADIAPDEATLKALEASVGVDKLVVDPASRTVAKRHPRVRCDFSALAAGYAADRVAAFLEARGHRDFLVDMSGELVARGFNEAGEPWRVAIERPRAATRSILRVVPLTDMAVSTSGAYRNYREVEGRRVTHILDPRTRRPVTHYLASVTVIAPSAAWADALSTALMVMGPDEGAAFAARHDVAALFVVPDVDGEFRERPSPAFTAWLSGKS
jgi:thiamine biosynthesis lipoprotein